MQLIELLIFCFEICITYSQKEPFFGKSTENRLKFTWFASHNEMIAYSIWSLNMSFDKWTTNLRAYFSLLAFFCYVPLFKSSFTEINTKSNSLKENNLSSIVIICVLIEHVEHTPIQTASTVQMQRVTYLNIIFCLGRKKTTPWFGVCVCM